MSQKIMSFTTSKKQLVLVSLSIILITSVSIISNNGDGNYESSSFTVFAQTEKDTNQKMLLHSKSIANSNSTINTNSTTFSSIGTISSLVITVPENEFNITNAFKVILTGDYILNVYNGNVKNFEVNFLASPMDGSRGHIHQITNFSTNHKELIQITPDNDSLSINGTADIKINGITIWNDVDLSVIISKNSTIIIDPNDRQTDNHFGDQQVYGIVNRLIVM
ncbi:MAG: hypothetical protein ACE5SW_13440 [Nitrososphaeraceae archaeon]